MPNLHLFTGGTGFVGSAIILELLQRTRGFDNARVVAIVRPGEVGASERLRSTLRRAARLYGHDSSLDAAIDARCEAVAGDLHEPRCGLSPKLDWEGAEFWHCAASLQYLDRHKQAIDATNVEGTRHALALAKVLRARRFNQVSTAYVAGTRTGVLFEEPVPVEARASVNNHYEASKIFAEALALTADPLQVRVLRPSIVVGHSRTHAALNYNGLYGFLRSLVKFRGLMDRAQAELGSNLRVRMRVDADATINFVPVDHVAADAVSLSLADARPGVYQLVSARPPRARWTLDTIFDCAGLRPPEYVDDPAQYSAVDRRFNERTDFYGAYFRGHKQFRRDRTNAAVGHDRGGSFVVDGAKLRALCGWYTDQLEQRRRALPVSA